jgi:nucleoid DNA-binding protein
MAEVKKQKKVQSKADIISAVAGTLDLAKVTVTEVVDAMLETIKKSIASGNRVTFIGFGTFKQSARKARTGRNPQTGKEIKIPASKSAGFRAGKAFKDMLNSPKKK